ncbi:MAG: hypothetical protein IJG53_00315 [Eggerthellaceae bacterium]|nr:hypothetical protein [Eggerthellaceae bacterium]
MDLIISHQSALSFWRRFSGNSALLPAEDSPTAMAAPMPLAPGLRTELAACGFAPSPESPLDLLFARGAVRSRAADIRAHSTVWPLPPGSLRRLNEHVLIASPELTFVQEAERRSLGQAIMCGCELCGTYVLFGPDGRQLTKPGTRPPLTTAARIRETVDGLELCSTARASRAAGYVLDGAASPMEARLALLLCLPTRLGGYGLPRPALNAPAALSREAFAVYPHSPCRLDLYWAGARFDVEYDGGEFHASDAHAKDVARTAALQLEGIEVLMLTKAQVFDARIFASLTRVIAEKLGIYLRIRTKDFEEKTSRLRRELGMG